MKADMGSTKQVNVNREDPGANDSSKERGRVYRLEGSVAYLLWRGTPGNESKSKLDWSAVDIEMSRCPSRVGDGSVGSWKGCSGIGAATTSQ